MTTTTTASDPPLSNAARRRLLIVDDHPIMRRGLTQLLECEPGLSIGGQAEDAVQAMAELRTRPYDLVTLDISLGGVSGIDLLKDIRIHWPKLPVLVLSMHDEVLYAERALRAGARGYVMKREATDQIVTAIRRLLDGHLYVSEEINRRMLNQLLDGDASADRSKPPPGDHVTNRLSNRELEVFRFIGMGQGTREIAGQMHVSIKTVETYRAHIKDKLQLRTAPELMRFAVHWVNAQGG